MKIAQKLAAVVVLCLLASCDGETDKKVYAEIIGGGFVFNYNVAEAYYGIVARVVREIPPGTVIEARFENPSGGAPIVVRQTAHKNRNEYVFQTTPVTGVKANRDYNVELRLLDPTGEQEIARYEKAFRSSADQSALPKRPLTVAPTYKPSAEAEKLMPKSDD